MIITSITLSIIALALSIWIGRKNPVKSSGLTAGMLVLLTLSPLLILLPKISVVVPWLEKAPVSNAVVTGGTTLSESSVGFLHVALWVWSIGIVMLSVRLLAHWMTARKWCKEAEVVTSNRVLRSLEECAEILNINRLPEVRVCRQIESPLVTGLMKSTILLPYRSERWSDDTLHMVLLHELGHVKRKDLWANMFSQVACVFHWFNPMVWMLKKRLQNECEYACDAHVIARGANAKHYIYALCDVAEQCSNKRASVAALAMANKASLKSRVENLLNKKRGSSPLLILSILAVTASATLAYNLIQPERERIHAPMDEQAQKPQFAEPPHMKHAPAEEKVEYTPEEIEKRLTADPFPVK